MSEYFCNEKNNCDFVSFLILFYYIKFLKYIAYIYKIQ